MRIGLYLCLWCLFVAFLRLLTPPGLVARWGLKIATDPANIGKQQSGLLRDRLQARDCQIPDVLETTTWV